MYRPGIGNTVKIGVLVVLILAAAVGILVVHLPAPAATSSSSTASASVVSAVSASGPVSVTVTRTTVDQTTGDLQSGDTIYIYDVTLRDSDNVTHASGTSYFALTGSSGAVYDAVAASAETQQLPNSTLSIGQQASGQVAFQVSGSDTPSKLEYKIPGQGVDVTLTSLPRPSLWVSNIAGVQATLPSTPATSNYFVSADIQNATTGLYLSNQTISVKLAISPYNYDDIVNGAVADITVTSIGVSNQGFSIASVTPTLPVTVSDNGNLAEVDLTVYVTLPSASVNVQTLDLTLSASG